ncbi:peptidoglycan DD-metalloendopeptidase family protein [Microvenator marinus]|uniref:Peptidoglycan DD-metalloendopeptidase family protein n=1 Tax=Microvenator marinus TaxID=2600177 RepID=A0A5B8Y0J0_9DELT|nr:M23 family metallopeptidase [Microvenator marinus]QED29456.1 peptidoglycan DD-metalloendopeptidase family protein [Microvenator marinus]
MFKVHALVLVLLVGAVGTSFAFTKPQTIFAKLDRLEVEAHEAELSASEHEKTVEELDKSIAQAALQRDLAERAAVSIRRRVVATLGAWEAASNRRGLTWEDQDTKNLLELASTRAIEPKLADLEVLQKVDNEQSHVESLIRLRASSAVVFAQHKAEGAQRRAERDEVLKTAAKDPNLKADLMRTDQTLHDSMLEMLKYETDRDFHKLKGTLLVPVTTPPSFKFGVRATSAADVTIRHTGWTFRTPKGTEVRSSADGLVVYAHHFEGYGMLVILDHGGGYHSLYAHLDKISVKTGEKVGKGATLGLSGETGSLEGPKFYFELRQGGKAIDPQAWFLQPAR